MKKLILLINLIIFKLYAQPNINNQDACRYSDHNASGQPCGNITIKTSVDKNRTSCAPGGNWSLVFSDDFNSSILDQDKWHKGYDHGNPVFCNFNDADNHFTKRTLYDESLMEISNGTLKVKRDKLPNNVTQLCGWDNMIISINDNAHPNWMEVVNSNGKSLAIGSYISGGGVLNETKVLSQVSGIPGKEGIYVISNNHTFPNQVVNKGVWTQSKVYKYGENAISSKQFFRHGFFEARCKLPENIYANPSFWLFSGVCDQEVDVFELFGDGYTSHKNRINQTIHKKIDCGGDKCQSFMRCLTKIGDPDWTDEFHTFGLLWDEYKVIWFIDGKVARIEQLATKHDFLGTGGGHVNSCEDWDKKNGKYFINKIFPTYQMDIRFTTSFNFSHKPVADPNNNYNQYLLDMAVLENSASLYPAYPLTMEVDWVKVWQKVDCNATFNVNDWNDYDKSHSQDHQYFPYEPNIAKIINIDANYKLHENRSYFATDHFEINGIETTTIIDPSDPNAIRIGDNHRFEFGIIPCPPTTGKRIDTSFDDMIDSIMADYNKPIEESEKFEKINPTFTPSPNPFSTTLDLNFSLPTESQVQIRITDALGVLVYTHTRTYDAGEQKLEFDTMKLPSGMYFVQFSAGDFHEMKKVIKN